MYMWKSHHIQTEKQGELVSIFSWKDCKRVPAAFSTTDLQGTLWNGKKQPQEVAVPKLPSQQVCEPTADGNTRRKDGQSSTGPFPAVGPTGSIHAPLPPTERNRSLKPPQIFFWPCKTLVFNALESWKWEYQSLPSCSVKCSMNCSAYGRNRCLLLTIPPCWAVFPLCDNTGNSVLIFLFCPQIKLWEAK